MNEIENNVFVQPNVNKPRLYLSVNVARVKDDQFHGPPYGNERSPL